MNYLRTSLTSLILATLLLCQQNIVAQRRAATPKEPAPYVPLDNTFWLQINPLMLAEPEISLGFTALYRVNKHLGLALETNVYVARYGFDDDDFEKYSGFRLRPEVKFYPNPESRRAKGMYFSLQGLYKNTNLPREEWLNNQSGTVNQLVSYKENKRVLGGAVKFGWEIMPGRAKKWMIDVYTGLGARNKQFKAVGLPNGIDIDYDNGGWDVFWDFDTKTNGFYPTVSLGVKFGFRIQ
ncbi:MAG: hypothetical protein V4722_15065 [Bacteroidota bacterium]